MGETGIEWRVTYTRYLGDKVRGTSKKDAFRFFDDDEKGLIGLEYTACLEIFDPRDMHWMLVGRIIKKSISNSYILLDNHGEPLSVTTLRRGILSDFFNIHHPTLYQFLSAINSPRANDYK